VPNASRHSSINLPEVHARNDAARHIITGFAASLPVLADIWQYVTDALDDERALSAEITRLSTELQDTRLDRANLLAAARATIAAYHEGEPDPLYYLRDELDARGLLPPGTQRHT
jgi:hypothetical protein